MSETPFYQTRMGRVFYDRTMPELVRQIARLKDLLRRLVQQLEDNELDDRCCAIPAGCEGYAGLGKNSPKSSRMRSWMTQPITQTPTARSVLR